MISYFGDFAEDDTVNIPFNTFSSDNPAASITITNLADADIMVHKDAGLTQIATDGATVVINFDSITGNHMVTIDTSAHADYTTGSEYAVRIEGTTIDSATINAWIGSFSIERAGGVLALLKGTNSLANIEDKIDIIDTNVDQIETAIITNAAGVDIAADIIALKAETVVILDDTDGLQVDLDTLTAGVSVTSLATNVITAASINASALDAKGDWNTTTPPTVQQIEDEVWNALQSAHTTVDTMGAIATEIAAEQTDLDTLTAGVTLAADAITSAKIADNAFLAVNFAASSLNGKGDWNTTTPSNHTLAAIADAIWNETLAGHVTADTSGLLLNDWQNAGRLDLILDTIAADTTTDIPGTISTLQTSVDAVPLLSEMFTAGQALDTTAGVLDVVALVDLVTTTTTLTNDPGILVSGTSDSGSTTTMIDSVRSEADTGYWIGDILVSTSGATSGQARTIVGFTPASDTITVEPPFTQSFGTSTYEIHPGPSRVELRTASQTSLDAIETDTTTDIPGTISTLQTSVDAVPLLSEMFTGNQALDTTAGVLDVVALVNVTTTNTDMVGTDGANTTTPPTAAAIVNEWETQSQADPTGFHVNLKEVNGTAQTALNINDILTDTAVIGALGAGLTDLGGMSTSMKAQVQVEADASLVSVNLDHWVGTATGIPTLPSGTYLDLMRDDGTAVYNRTTDSLQAIRDHATTIKTETASIQVETTALDTLTKAAGAGDLAAILIDTNAVEVLTKAAGNGDLAAILTDTASLNDGAISELGVAQPTTTPTLQNAVMLLYMALRNKTIVQTSGTDALEIHNSAGTKITQKLLTDSAGDYTEAKMG